jgi:hypothetical protein
MWLRVLKHSSYQQHSIMAGRQHVCASHITHERETHVSGKTQHGHDMNGSRPDFEKVADAEGTTYMSSAGSTSSAPASSTPVAHFKSAAIQARSTM